MKHAGHHLLFRLKCLESKDIAFQRFFEKLMALHDSTFLPVKPAGPEGDWKSDGYSTATGTIYQCYGPDELRTGKTSRKIREDFAGAEKMWGPKMKRWVFVWNAAALPPQVVAVIAEIAAEYEHRVTIDHLGPEKLWDEVVSHLSSPELVDLLGELPGTSDLQASQLRLAGRALRHHDLELTKELCLEVLDATKGNHSLLAEYLEACNIMVCASLNENDLKSARYYLSQASKCVGADSRPALRAQFFQVEGSLLRREQRGPEAEAAFCKGLDIHPASTADAKENALVEELQCAIRSDLILYLAETKQTERSVIHADAAEAYILAHPGAQDSHLLPWVADALISLAIRQGDLDRANRALDLLEEHSGSQEQAMAAVKLLHNLTGRAGHLGATDIAMACCDVSSRIARRAALTEDFWAAQYNAAGVYLQDGNVMEAQKRLRSLWPLLDSDDIPRVMKAAFLMLASELATEKGDHLQAIELQQKALPYVGAEPFQQAVCSFHLARKLEIVGRVEEAREALEAATRIGKECEAPEEFLFEAIASRYKCEVLLGHWETAEALLDELGALPRAERYSDNALEAMRQQLDSSRLIRQRIDEIREMVPTDPAPTLTEANAMAIRPLLDWWQEIASRTADQPSQDLGLRTLYDYWGSGGAVEVMANLRRFAPDHFSPFVEVRSLSDIRRAIRMFSLFSDMLVLLWKGPIKTGRVFSFFPFDNVKGGGGYIFGLGTKAFESPSSGPWFLAIGDGAYLPEEVCEFLATEALPLLAQGRLLVLPAPAVGCWQPHHGPCESARGFNGHYTVAEPWFRHL